MRQRIHDAAVDVLAQHGYAGFRTADVAIAAGVSRGALTHHYPTKDELVLAALEHVFRKAAERGRQRADRVHSVDRALKSLLEDSRDFFFSELFLIAVDLAIVGQRDGERNARIREMSRAHRLPVEAAWVEALIESGVPPREAEDLLWLTVSIVRGLAIRRLLADDPPRFARVLSLWRRMAVEHVERLTRSPGAG